MPGERYRVRLAGTRLIFQIALAFGSRVRRLTECQRSARCSFGQRTIELVVAQSADPLSGRLSVPWTEPAQR